MKLLLCVFFLAVLGMGIVSILILRVSSVLLPDEGVGLVWKKEVPTLGATAFMCYEQNVDDSINSLYHFMYCMTVKEYIHIYTIGTLHVLHKHESTMVNWLEVHTSHLTPKNATRISAISLPLWIWALRTQGAHFHPVQKGELAKTAPRKQRNEWEVGCNPHISHVYCE